VTQQRKDQYLKTRNFRISPKEGSLNGKTVSKVSLGFSPKKLKMMKISVSWNIKLRLNIIETHYTQEILLSGNGHSIKYHMTLKDFNFGKQFVNTKITQELKITTKSFVLPLNFSFHKTPDFIFRPLLITIKPSATTAVEVYFPKELTIFQVESVVSICRKLEKSLLYLSGRSVSKDIEEKKFEILPIWKIHPFTQPDPRYSLTINEIKHNSAIEIVYHSFISKNAKKNISSFIKICLKKN
jgi:hypothetical protein